MNASSTLRAFSGVVIVCFPAGKRGSERDVTIIPFCEEP